ncbi:MAG: hypothetical protein ABSC71_08120, partial [Candidatus Acidiferrales bacterium]
MNGKLVRTVCAVSALIFSASITTFAQDQTPASSSVPAAQSATSAKSPTANAPKSAGVEQPGARPGHRTVTPRVTADTLVEIEKAGVLRVGVALIIPWAMHDKNGELIGFEI